MSISCAPTRTASSVSAILTEVKLCPDGNAVATEAIRTVLPRRCSTQSAMRSGYTHTAATEGMVASPGLGRMALAHMAATLPGVSAPSRVVRSMQRTARSSAQSLDDFLIERLASEAARSSAPTSSTLRTPRISEPRWVRERAVAMLGLCDGMKRTSRFAGIAASFLVAACGPNQAAVPVRPSPVVSPATSSLPTALAPVQRMEASLPTPVEETGAASAGGKLYVIGGFNAAGASLDSVYVFDGSTWAAGPRLPLPVDHPSAATMEDRVYLAGGHTNGRDSARLFRLDSDHWTELAAMHYARGGHALVAAAGRLYAIGGNSSRDNIGPIEAFDPGSNAWTVLPALPVARNHVSGFVAGGAACIAGGRSPPTARVDCFDPATGTWSRLSDLLKPTSGGGATTFDSGDVVMTGGQDASETRIVDQLAFYTRGGGWKTSDTMMWPRHGFELAVFERRAWACGGGSAPGLHPVTTCTSLGDAPAANG